jgi:tRNA nucleotidyltransferase (CCA-adding enzyme)
LNEKLKRYKVGGYVRDHLLGRVSKDCDWVVVGATTKVMLEHGYQQVGADFPVFLHPETKDEHALARTERKTNSSSSLTVYADPSVTLEEDLNRRDLTINAIAMDDSGKIIDTYGGVKDLHEGVLRHVSEAFIEDPIRILRTARFAARFHFVIAKETQSLMKSMVRNNALTNLTPERVWLEIEKVLHEQKPVIFFEVLQDIGALETLFPELAALCGVPQPVAHHPEIDSWIHVKMALNIACELSSDPEIRFAALMHDLGKGITPKEELPHHFNHEKTGVPLVKAVCDRYRSPNSFRALACLASEHHLRCHRVFEMKPGKIIKLLMNLDAFRQPNRFEKWLVACEADARGRLGKDKEVYTQAVFLRECLGKASQVTGRMFVEKGCKGEVIGDLIHQERARVIQPIHKAWQSQKKGGGFEEN